MIMEIIKLSTLSILFLKKNATSALKFLYFLKIVIIFIKLKNNNLKYPADNVVTFYNISVEFDGQKVTP